MLFVSQDAVLDMIADSDPDSSCREICRLYSDVLDMSAVEVVRCKDCVENDAKYGNEENWCLKFGYTVHDDDFCSYGERETDE